MISDTTFEIALKIIEIPEFNLGSPHFRRYVLFTGVYDFWLHFKCMTSIYHSENLEWQIRMANI